jgi:ribosomal subunit interface protein
MKIHFSAEGLELSSELEKYVDGKVARLNRRTPRALRAAASCHVLCKQVAKKDVKYNTCTMTLHIDDTEFKAEETTIHMYAALDIAAVHIEQQLADHVRRSSGRGILRRLRTNG